MRTSLENEKVLEKWKEINENGKVENGTLYFCQDFTKMVIKLMALILHLIKIYELKYGAKFYKSYKS